MQVIPPAADGHDTSCDRIHNLDFLLLTHDVIAIPEVQVFGFQGIEQVWSPSNSVAILPQAHRADCILAFTNFQLVMLDCSITARISKPDLLYLAEPTRGSVVQMHSSYENDTDDSESQAHYVAANCAGVVKLQSDTGQAQCCSTLD